MHSPGEDRSDLALNAPLTPDTPAITVRNVLAFTVLLEPTLVRNVLTFTMLLEPTPVRNVVAFTVLLEPTPVRNVVAFTGSGKSPVASTSFVIMIMCATGNIVRHCV